MGKRVKFNVHDIFMDGQNTVENRTLFVSSPLFGIFAALYNRAGGDIKVGLLESKTEIGGTKYISSVPIVSPLGIGICEINNYGFSHYNDIAFDIQHEPLNGTYMGSRMRSTNPKYIQNRLSSTSVHDAAGAFDAALNRARKAINSTIWRMVDLSIDKKFGDSLTGAPTFNGRGLADGYMITFLARHFAGEVQQSEMNAAHRQEFDDMFAKYTNQRERFKSALKETHDMVSTEKWFYATRINGGVLLGAIRPEPMCAALDQYMNHNSLPPHTQFNYVQESMPFKWYPTYEHIPEDIRQQLEFSMVMLKAHTGASGMLPEQPGEKHYYELGCWYSGYSADRPYVYVLTK